jgi:hypothetical protein
LFHAELHTVTTNETRVQRVVRAGSLTFSVRELRRVWYLPCMMKSNNAE